MGADTFKGLHTSEDHSRKGFRRSKSVQVFFEQLNAFWPLSFYIQNVAETVDKFTKLARILLLRRFLSEMIPLISEQCIVQHATAFLVTARNASPGRGCVVGLVQKPSSCVLNCKEVVRAVAYFGVLLCDRDYCDSQPLTVPTLTPSCRAICR